MIELNKHNCQATKDMVENFENSDVFSKSRENFRSISHKFQKFEQRFYEDIKPKIDQSIMDQKEYTKRH